jgi:hypothetical protein
MPEVEKVKVKKLTKKQLDILYSVFCHRFITVNSLADYYNQKHFGGMRRILEQLRHDGYLNRRFNPLYKLAHRPAEYFATIDAIPVLRTNFPDISSLELRQIYNRATVSERFVHRSLTIFDISNQIKRLYGDKLTLLTKPQLNIEQFEYLPHPLPDIFTTRSKQNLFIEYFDDEVSIGIHGRKIYSYMKYKESGQWDDTGLDFPTVVIICQSPTMLKRAEKRVRYLDRQEFSEISFRLIDMPSLKTLDSIKNIAWIDPIEQEKIAF